MSSSTKKKHVTAEALGDFSLPGEGEAVARIEAGRGNNLHLVEDEGGQTYLVSMPRKFRKTVWVKKGDFVVVTPIEEGDKVKAEIQRVLYRDQIRFIKSEGKWPDRFSKARDEEGGEATATADKVAKEEDEGSSGEDSSEDSDSDLFVNTNRPAVVAAECSSDDEEESEAKSESEGEDSDRVAKDEAAATGEK